MESVIDHLKIEEGISNMRESGFAIFPEVLSKEEIQHFTSISCELSEHILSKKERKEKDFHGDSDNIKVIANLQNKHFDYWKLIAHPLVITIADCLLKEGSYQAEEPYQLATSIWRSISGELPGQQLHIDSRLPGSPFALSLVAGWSLTEFTRDNGATRFVPGSHLLDHFPETGLKRSDECIAECPPGSLIIFNAGLWHGSSEKIDTSERSGLFFNYNRWFMRQSHKINRGIPTSIRDKLTPKMIELSGAFFEEALDENERTVRISKDPQW